MSRAELTRAVGRRLRGASSSLAGLAQIDYYLTAASATTSLGVLLLGAAVPGLLAGSSAPRFVVGVALLAVPLVLFAAYLVPRWLTQPRAETVADRVIPILRPWSRVLGLLLPARTATRPTDLRSIWREGAAVGLEDDGELVMVGGVMAFSARPVREVMTPANRDRGHRGERAAGGDPPRLCRQRLQPDSGHPGHAGRHHWHAACVRSLQARARRPAAGSAGRGHSGEPHLRRPPARHAAGAAPPRGGARRVRRHPRHRDAGRSAGGAGGRDLR